jgi:serine/threonine protein kinase
MSGNVASDGSRYINREKLGKGSYGDVFQARDSVTGKLVALKIQGLESPDGIPRAILRELSVLQSINHPNLISVNDVFFQPGTVTIVTDYMTYDLRHFLHYQKQPVQPKLIQSYAFQLLCGVYHLHTHGVFHRDLKPENILLDEDGMLKICDFGLSRFVTLPLGNYTPEVISTWYRPPELLTRQEHYDLSSEIWSIGCILGEIARGVPIGMGDSDIDQLQKFFKVLGTPTSDEQALFRIEASHPVYDRPDFFELLQTNDAYFVDLVSRMLQYNPKKRITTAEALRHPYFQTVHNVILKRCWPSELERPL